MKQHPAHSLPEASQEKLKHFFQLGLKHGCPRDQLLNFSNAGIILQDRQLAASAAARLCDQPDGPKAVGYGGARGGGKTHWLLAQLGADDCQRVPGLKCLLLRKVGKANLENFEALRRLFDKLPHEFNASRGLLIFANGSRITLGHYQSEKDIDTYLGLEYDVIGIEEATQLTPRKYEDISTCCRTSKTNWRPRIYSTTNPGGIGHQWYLEKFILPHQSGTESDTRFIPARVEDNAFINADYEVNLNKLTGWQYDAWRQGLWNFPAGQYFKNFRPELHVLAPDFKAPGDGKWVAAMDYGYTHLTVALFGCEDHQGCIYVLDEHAERFWIPQRHAQAIKIMLARHSIFADMDHVKEHLLALYPNYCTERERLWHFYKHRRLLERFVAGSDMFSRESNGDSVANQYRAFGLKLRAATMDRVSGWSSIAQRLGDPAAGIAPTLFFHPRCRRLLATLPMLQHDPDRPGDILKTNIAEDGVGGDDAADALRYLVCEKTATIHVIRLRGY
jgi:phage terminase large subunit